MPHRVQLPVFFNQFDAGAALDNVRGRPFFSLQHKPLIAGNMLVGQTIQQGRARAGGHEAQKFGSQVGGALFGLDPSVEIATGARFPLFGKGPLNLPPATRPRHGPAEAPAAFSRIDAVKRGVRRGWTFTELRRLCATGLTAAFLVLPAIYSFCTHTIITLQRSCSGHKG